MMGGKLSRIFQVPITIISLHCATFHLLYPPSSRGKDSKKKIALRKNEGETQLKTEKCGN